MSQNNSKSISQKLKTSKKSAFSLQQYFLIKYSQFVVLMSPRICPNHRGMVACRTIFTSSGLMGNNPRTKKSVMKKLMIFIYLWGSARRLSQTVCPMASCSLPKGLYCRKTCSFKRQETEAKQSGYDRKGEIVTMDRNIVPVAQHKQPLSHWRFIHHKLLHLIT